MPSVGENVGFEHFITVPRDLAKVKIGESAMPPKALQACFLRGEGVILELFPALVTSHYSHLEKFHFGVVCKVGVNAFWEAVVLAFGWPTLNPSPPLTHDHVQKWSFF